MRLSIRIARVAPTAFFGILSPRVASGFGLLPSRGMAQIARKLDAFPDQQGEPNAASWSRLAIFDAKAPLPSIEHGISVVSFNVLLPNGNDGWWIYKSYQPHVPEEHRAWPYRQALIKEYLLGKNADVVCIQEASAETFESDFAFMKDAGYSFVLHNKFRFRSATFFKSSKLKLACEKHKDRVLVIGLHTLPTHAAPEQSPTPSEARQPLAEDTAEGAQTLAGQYTARGDGIRHDQASKSPEIKDPTGSAQDRGEEGSSPATQSGDDHLVMVVNCHLTGGPVPERRMRQVLDGLDTARKEAAKVLVAQEEQLAAVAKTKGVKHDGGKAGKAKGKGKGKGKGSGGGAGAQPGASVPVVVCGDFNSRGRTAVWELLTAGTVEASYREAAYPEIAITSKDKRQTFGAFGDVYEEAYDMGGAEVGGDATSPPPTFLVPLLHTHFLDENGAGLSPRLQVALSEVFRSFVENSGDTNTTDVAEDVQFLPREGVEAWLLKINRAIGRGSEFRAAEAFMGPGPGDGLTLEAFFSIYANELREGKFWGVAHDLHACGAQLPGGMPWVGPYTARFDRMFYSAATLEAVGAMESLSEEDKELVYGGDCLPNSWHPSDHLAVGGVFRFR